MGIVTVKPETKPQLQSKPSQFSAVWGTIVGGRTPAADLDESLFALAAQIAEIKRNARDGDIAASEQLKRAVAKLADLRKVAGEQ
ncbi:MAG: hypothetical protein WBQ34_03770 [Candidatus Acidiferrales bacterium]